jgi:hypothetical protein
MSRSIYVKGYRSPNDEKHQKHLKVLKVCREVGVSLPEETSDYFDGIRPEYIDPDSTLEVKIPVHEVVPRPGSEGYEIILSEIPQGVYKIQFEYS